MRGREHSAPEVVVVTGASAGVGRATVREFAKRRARIGLIARGLDGLEGARLEVEAARSWDAIWIYFAAPTLAMLLAVKVFH